MESQVEISEKKTLNMIKMCLGPLIVNMMLVPKT